MNKAYLPLLLLATLLLGMALNEAITRSQVETTAEVLGLDFLDADEIDLMLPDLEDTRKDLLEISQLKLDNGVSPALIFDPFVDLSAFDGGFTEAVDRSVSVKLPRDRSELAWFTIPQLAHLIQSKQITSRELTEFFLDRLTTYDPTLHCVITLTRERALAQADLMDQELAGGKYRGLLHGIPYGAKDLLAAKGYKTTWGAAPYKDQTIDTDAAVIEQLEAAGAVLCAKLTLGALAWGDVWYGEMTRNPWDTEKGSSGSSAGSASAVAAGLLPFAIGTETLGSIVSPSTVCGTTGLRPTYGTVSRYGAMALSWTMDKIGPITRSAGDAAIVLEAISKQDGRDRHQVAVPFFDVTPQRTTRRIGYLKSAFDRPYPFHDNDSIALAALRGAGYELVPIELPETPPIGFILNVEAAAAFEDLTRSNRDDELTRQIRNAWPNTFRSAHFVPAVAYVQANRARRTLMEKMTALFKDNEIDVYVNPSWNSSSLFITNMTGQPSITVPSGFHEGTPTSITFTGGLLREIEIVEVAGRYQSVTEWEDRHPENF